MLLIFIVCFAVVVGALVWTKLTIEEYQEDINDLCELGESLAKNVREETELLYKRQETLLLKVSNLSSQVFITAKTLDKITSTPKGKHAGEDRTHAEN